MRIRVSWSAAVAWAGLLALLSSRAGAVAADTVWLVVHNDLGQARLGETVEVPVALFRAALGDEVLRRVRVVEEASGRELPAQAVDLDDDLKAEMVVFQADFAPHQSRTFRLEKTDERAPEKEDFRVYGRFVRERHDDFAWENDRVAFRVYGEALETWEREPLTSSAVDAWCKRTTRLILDDWYMVDDYHHDHGEGGDFYPAGRSRGCGGSGLWREGSLVVSKNFRASRVLAAGPIRLVFELDYPLWEGADPGVVETKRVTLDAGGHLNRFESRYTSRGGTPTSWVWAAGTKIEKGALIRSDAERGLVRSYEPLDRYGDNGWLGCGVLADPTLVSDVVEDDGNLLLVLQSPPGEPARYYAGTGWDRGGQFKDVGEWDAYLETFAERLGSPLRVEIETSAGPGREAAPK
jgi:hypothetical protein